jgi:hypothetical protein
MWLWLVRLYYTFHISHKGHNFHKKKLLNIKCVLSTNFVSNISQSKKNPVSYCNKCTSFFTKSTRYSSHKRNFDFLDRFFKNIQIQNFMKIRPVGAEFSMRTDRQADLTKLFAFRNFATAPKTFLPAESTYRQIYDPSIWKPSNHNVNNLITSYTR